MVKAHLQNFRSLLVGIYERVQFGSRFARHAELGITARRLKPPCKLHGSLA